MQPDTRYLKRHRRPVLPPAGWGGWGGRLWSHAAQALRVRALVCLMAVALLLSGVSPAHAQSPFERPSQEQIWFKPAPKISVLTFGPGDEPFLKFGHNAIRVQYPNDGPDVAYNFGTFRFDSPWLIIDFLTGKFEYWLSVATFESTLRHYKEANRDVKEQLLALGNPTAWDVAEQLRKNALPENRVYLYDYYRDNCSTRVRDVVDPAVHGVLQERTSGRGSMSLRDHTLRLVADDFWLYTGLDIAMGPYIDQEETRWSEMFLPSKLEEGLETVVFSGPHGTQPLVKERKTHYAAIGRQQLRRQPPDRTWAYFQGGAAFGALMGFLGWEAYQRRQDWARSLLAALLALFGLVTGVLGLLFTGLWTLTNHEVTYYNENILQCAPWAIGLVGCAWGVHKNRESRIDWAYRIAMAGVVAASVGLVAKLLPMFAQHNERIIALFLPMWMGVFTGLHFTRLRARRLLLLPITEPQGDTAAAEDRDSDDPPVPSRPPPSRKDKEKKTRPEKEAVDEAPSPGGEPAPA